MMKRFVLYAGVWAGCASLTGCASVNARLPQLDAQSLSAETATQERQAFARYENMLVRLETVSARILQANTGLCPKTQARIGARTHTKKTYSKHLRDSAVRQFGAKDDPVVFSVRDGSPAQKAGIMRGDMLLDAKGKPVHSGHKNLFTDVSSVRVLRDGEEHILDIAPETVCAYPVSLRMSGAVNAYATGRSIIVTTGMMDFVQTDAELALVVGHELAHNTMDHVPKSIRNMVLSGFATRYTRPFEAEADYVGLYHMARAGYDLDGVEVFWRRLGVAHPKNIVRAKTHPVTPARLLSIRMGIGEIKSKGLAKQELRPNMMHDE